MRRVFATLLPSTVPVALAFPWLLRMTSLQDGASLFFANVLWVGAPHLVFGLSAVWWRSLRRHAVPVLWCLSLYLVCFALWVRNQALPSPGAGFFWIFYPIGALVVLFFYGAFVHRTKPTD
jgi:hypothetical protein